MWDEKEVPFATSRIIQGDCAFNFSPTTVSCVATDEAVRKLALHAGNASLLMRLSTQIPSAALGPGPRRKKGGLELV